MTVAMQVARTKAALAEILARGDVGDVHLDRRNADGLERVEQGDALVCV